MGTKLPRRRWMAARPASFSERIHSSWSTVAAESLDCLSRGARMVMKRFRACLRAAVLLAMVCAVAVMARAQNPVTAGDPPTPGSSMPGNRELPAKPGEQVSPDPFTKYHTDPLTLRAEREQAELRGETRQKQIVEATSLLLQIAQDLRKEIASLPSADASAAERTRLEHIQKLAHMIRERERTQDDVSTTLAKAGVL